MKGKARELKNEADDFRDSGKLDKAGETYTKAAHEWAGATERSFPGPGYTRNVLSSLLNAATCYRVNGDEFRTGNRCELGTVIAEDHLDYIERVGYEEGSFADCRRGAWFEYIGDLRVIAKRDDASDAYDRATSIYESAGGDYEFVIGEQEHMQLAAFFRSIRWGLGHEIPDEAPEQQAPGMTFTEWVEYKRERLPGLLDDLESQGTWPR